MSKTKNIAIVIDSLNGGGAERVCLLLAKHFVTRGFNTHLILLKQRCDYEIPENISVFSPSQPSNIFQRFTKLNYTSNQIAAYLKIQGEFEKIFVHLRDAYRVMASLNLPNTWYVLHNAINATIEREKKLGPLKRRRAIKSYEVLNGKNLICVSKGIEDEIKELSWLSPNEITTIYNPVDQSDILAKAKEENSAIPDKKYIIHVGRAAKQKRHDILFQALRQLPEDISLVLLCKASSKLKKLIREHDIESRVIVAGWQHNPFNWIKHSACLALSSDYEGFGLVIAEALTLDTPVVSTNCPFGPNEILTGELEKFLVPCGDSQALANTILSAIESQDRFINTPILEAFSAAKIADQYLSL